MDVTSATRGNESSTGEDGWFVAVFYSETEMADLLSRYDPASGTSPSVADSRPTVRAILDAVKEKQA